MIGLRVADVKQVLGYIFREHKWHVCWDIRKHEVSVSEFKASDFFRGDRGWQKITLSDKFEIIGQICCVVKSENIKIIGTAISQVETNKQIRRIRRISGVKMNTWLVAGILMCASVQHEMASSEKDVGRRSPSTLANPA